MLDKELCPLFSVEVIFFVFVEMGMPLMIEHLSGQTLNDRGLGIVSY